MDSNYFSSDNELKYKIIIVGDPYVGKTTLFWRYIEGEFLNEQTMVTTIDFKIKKITIQGLNVKLYIWDTAGQEKYRSIVSSYFKGCDGVMLVFDLTNPASFISVTTKWYELAKSKSPDAQLLLVGNKSDLDINIDEKQPQLWARDHGAIYVRTSVKRDVNVNQCFRKLAQSIFEAPKVERANSFSLGQKQLGKSDCC